MLAVLPCGALADYTPVEDGVIVHTADGNVRLKVINDKIIRVSATPGTDFPADASLVVIPVKDKPVYKLSQKDGNVYVSTNEVKAVVSEKTGAVSFFDKAGKKILQKTSREERSLRFQLKEPTVIRFSRHSSRSTITRVSTVSDNIRQMSSIIRGRTRNFSSIIQKFPYRS